jgi:PIN domain nuclease of toxin-antitoxin system
MVFVSVASAWEIAIKRALGRLMAPGDLEQQLGFHRFEPIAVELRHALMAADLPLHHKDPFDRLLVAQAITENLTVVTRDRAIARYAVRAMAA